MTVRLTKIWHSRQNRALFVTVITIAYGYYGYNYYDNYNDN